MGFLLIDTKTALQFSNSNRHQQLSDELFIALFHLLSFGFFIQFAVYDLQLSFNFVPALFALSVAWVMMMANAFDLFNFDLLKVRLDWLSHFA